MPKKLTLIEIAELLNAEWQGNPDATINSISSISGATANQAVYFSEARFFNILEDCLAGVIIISPEHAPMCPNKNLVITQNPKLGMAILAKQFEYQPQFHPQIHPSAVIDPSASIAPTVKIGAHVVIGQEVTIDENSVIYSGCVLGDGAIVGKNCILYPNVTLYHHVQLKNHIILHSGVIIGCDGFGLAQENHIWHKVPQMGSVIIEDDVEVGANTTIDRGTIDDTYIHQGVKIDNQVQVAHNVHIGEHTAIAACVGISGSTHIGKYCMIGGASGIGGHLTLADHVSVTGMSMITKSINKAGIYSSGTGFFENLTWRKNVARFRQLDQIIEKIKQLEKTHE